MRARIARWLGTTGAVLAIVAASMVGLNEWADGVATHVVVPSDGTSRTQELTAS